MKSQFTSHLKESESGKLIAISCCVTKDRQIEQLKAANILSQFLCFTLMGKATIRALPRDSLGPWIREGSVYAPFITLLMAVGPGRSCLLAVFLVVRTSPAWQVPPESQRGGGEREVRWQGRSPSLCNLGKGLCPLNTACSLGSSGCLRVNTRRWASWGHHGASTGPSEPHHVFPFAAKESWDRVHRTREAAPFANGIYRLSPCRCADDPGPPSWAPGSGKQRNLVESVMVSQEGSLNHRRFLLQ